MRSQKEIRRFDIQRMFIFALALLCATAPLDFVQLAFVFIGAISWGVLNYLNGSGSSLKKDKVSEQLSYNKGKQRSKRQQVQGDNAGSEHKPILRQSAVPIPPLKFTSVGWDAEVEELAEKLAPTAGCDKMVSQVSSHIQETLRKFITDVEVVGFAGGDCTRASAYGVAVPDVDIVVHMGNPKLFGRKFQVKPVNSEAVVDARKLQKAALRACCDRLVSAGGYKFRRSAFRYAEPKVTLLAPINGGEGGASIPIDLYVNNLTPIYNAALFSECKRLEPRATALILLVKRWAKDRGICHASRGHLSPYLWRLLTIYFLQLGVKGESPLLPPVETFDAFAKLAEINDEDTDIKQAIAFANKADASAPSSEKMSIGALFKQFLNFYAAFDWATEAVAVRKGVYAPAGNVDPSHAALDSSGQTKVTPTIDDPFEQHRNLGICMTTDSFNRLKDELARAAKLCAEDASLADLLQLWAPPPHVHSEQAASCPDKDEAEEEGEDAFGTLSRPT